MTDMSSSWVGGLDLGCQQDFSALALLERTASLAGTGYAVRGLHRWPRGTPYVGLRGGANGVVEDVKLWLADPTRRASTLLAVDQTGVGLPIVHSLRAQGMPVPMYPVVITGGHSVTAAEDGSFHVPKRDLVSVVMLLLQTGRLVISPELPLAGVLAEELRNFKVSLTAAANEIFDAREGENDDCVLAVALACWLGERFPVWGPESVGIGRRRDVSISHVPGERSMGGDFRHWPRGI
jgi:hypothetical protein